MTTPARQPLAVHGGESISAYGPARATVAGTPLSREELRRIDAYWRAKVASLNLLITALVWRQDQNGFTHQDPGFLDVVANKSPGVVRIYLPPDANCLLSVADHCLRSVSYVNVIVADKQVHLQYLDMEAAIAHCTKGAGIWNWASNDQGAEPDVVMASCGDVPTMESLAATALLRQHLSGVKVRFVNVVDLFKLVPHTEHPHGMTDREFEALFTATKPVVFNFHSYPWLIHRLTYRRPGQHHSCARLQRAGKHQYAAGAGHPQPNRPL